MWKYSEETLKQFKEQKNAGEIENPDGRAEIGNASCGDALTLTFKLDDEGRIADAKFLTYGCVSAIAASSMLTQMIIGLTLDEALKITNKDIADRLGGLPEAKMHCSVMGMEALHAAIANYRGEPNPFENDEDHEGRLICRCFGVTDVKVLKVARENQLRNAEEVTQYCKAGGACGSCLDDIQRILDDMWKFDQALKK
jgi:NifU-like protein